ncbi:hypothetical protein BGZ92_006564, partial [Podila epicladia]
MCELHSIVNVFPPGSNKGYGGGGAGAGAGAGAGGGGGGGGGGTGENIAKWIPLARQAIEVIGRKDAEKRQAMERFGFEQLVSEIDQVEREIAASVNSPIVFAHNDTQYGNILQTLDPTHELVVIDFEYAGYNTRGFDIGNHFCEWMADYHSARPSLMHQDRYPSKQEQLNFLEAYMEAEIAITGYHLTAMDPHQFSTKGSRRRRLKDALASGLTLVASLRRKRTSSEMDAASSESNINTTFVTSAGDEVAPPPPATTTTTTTRGGGGGG